MTVKQQQCLLAYLGYYTGAVDGIWGNQTQEATRRFQQDFGLTPDGIFGVGTEERIRQAIGNYDDLVLVVPANATISQTETVAKNATAEDSAVTGTFWDEIQNFDRDSEFGCTCQGRGCNGFPAEPQERLVRNLQDVRTHFGKPVQISSGVRCQLRNSELPGSAGNSLHMRGKAADFCVRSVHSSVVLAYVKNLPNVDEAYAIDESFVHMGVLKYN